MEAAVQVQQPRRHHHWHVVSDTLQVVPLLILTFMMSLPHHALAFTEHVYGSGSDIIFIRDPELVDRAIIGIDAFEPNTHGQSRSRGRLTYVPSAVKNVVAGSTLSVVAAAYSSTPGQTDNNPFITASGERVQEGTMAANFLPFGTQVEIHGKVYTVTDRMNARYNNKAVVDLWQPSYEEAITFGVRIVPMKILSLP